MTQAGPSVAAPSPAPPPETPLRRRPRAPRRSSLLLVVWLLVLVSGLGLFAGSVQVSGPYGQPALKVSIIVVVLGNWLLLFWRARILKRMDEKVQRARGAVCLNCHALLTREGQEGTCPECGEAFTLKHLRDVWHKHMP